MAKILTLDAGTSAIKCSIFNEDGQVLSACTVPYQTYYPGEGRAEQNADELLRAALTGIRLLGEQTPLTRIDCVGLTGTMNGCIPLDGEGRALYPNMIHLDTRAQAQVDRLSARLGFERFYRLSGNRPDVHYGLPKLMWLKDNEPEVYEKAAVCVNSKDLIYGFLTGCRGRTDYSDASLFGALNIHDRAWDEEICAAAEIDRAKLPELYPSTFVGACISPQIASLTGLSSGTPVAVGAGDGAATTHGSGVFDETGAYLTVGSSAWVAALSAKPCIDPGARAFNYVDMDERLINVCGTVQCASTALDYMLRDVLALTQNGEIDFALAESLCLQAPPGANGLFFLPTLMGERCPWWDPKARGALFGLTLSHTRADMVRAAYEGVAQELNLCVGVLRQNGIPARSLILSGGGMRSRVYREIFPSVFGAKTRLHLNPLEATSHGAAIAAGVGLGIWKSFQDAAKTVKTGEEQSPEPEMEKAYQKQAKLFEKLFPLVKDAMHLAGEASG